MKKKGVQRILAVVLCAAMLSGNGHITALAEQVSGGKTETKIIQMTESVEESPELPTGGVEIPLAEKETVAEGAENTEEIFAQQQIEYESEELKVNGEFNNDYGYLSLETIKAKECYNLIKNAACAFHENFGETTERTSQSGSVNYIWNTVEISEYELERDEFRKVLFAIEADYPEFFWFNGDFSYNTTTVNGAEVVKKAYLRVEDEYAGIEERKTAQQAIEDGRKIYLEAIDKARALGADDMAIELLLHDMIIEAVEYAYVEGTTTPSDAAYAHSVVGVFDKLGVVCEGYSKTFQMLLNYAEIESIYAIGYGNGGGHAWNLVCLDGEWYNVDLTWNDITEEKYDGVQYSFYNCNTENFGNHVYVPSVFPGMYEVPDTIADKYNYYKYYGLYVTSEVVADEESFLDFMKQVTEESCTRKDYLLQFGFDSANTQSTFREYLRNGKSNIEERCSNSESIYKSKGTISSVNNQWYSVYFPMVRIYADTYQINYQEQGAELEFHVVDGRKEISKDNNYTVFYTDNTSVGTGKAQVTGIGNYDYLGTNEFEFIILGKDEITITPTSTLESTNTPTPTKVPVQPGKITGLKLKSANASSVKISFEKQNCAAGYHVVLYKGSKVIKSIETTATTYTFKNLSPATTYTVKVCGYTEKGNEASYGSYSKTLKVVTATKAPIIKSVTAGKKEAVITWKKVKGATGYEIYIASKKAGAYKKVATIKKASTVKYTKKKLVSGQTYYFKIRTYKTVGGKKIYSSYSKVKSVGL